MNLVEILSLNLIEETEELIREELKVSHIGVQGEELASEVSEDIRWVVDPIDGTANYFRGLDQCCVSIALMNGNECLIGVIYNFNTKELYEATKGHGAKLNNQPIAVSNIKEKHKASLTTGFPASETVDSSYEFLDDLKGWKKIRMFGSAWHCHVHMLLQVNVTFYAEKGVYLWDFAAGIILVEEAGGVVEFQKLDDERYSVNISNGLL